MLFNWMYIFVVVQLLSLVWLFETPWTAACQSPLSFTISRNLLKFMSTEFILLSDHLILCHSLFLLPLIFSNTTVFSNESTLCIKWPKYWSFSFSISPSSEYSELISFSIDWFDLLAVQGTHKNLQLHKFWKHQFFGMYISIFKHNSAFSIFFWVLKNTRGKTLFYTSDFIHGVLLLFTVSQLNLQWFWLHI